ncbi:MAG: hypothetical protein P8Y27_07175 [Chromatiaceae bacterium]|jgi:hypoxanthine phosphoribosyltransferase
MIIAITRRGYPAARVFADYFGIMDLVPLKTEHTAGRTRCAAQVPAYGGAPCPLG